MPPKLDSWSNGWRYLIAIAVGGFAWIAYAAVLTAPARQTTSQGDRIGVALLIDSAIGAVAVASLTVRRRLPLAVACLVAAASAVSVASIGALIVAVVSMATWRRWWWVLVTATACVAGAILSESLYRPWFTPARVSAAEGSAGSTAANVFIVLGIYAAAVAAGFYIGTRRELLASLRERAATLEREQLLLASAARTAERTRIAREMHDELAHRISLVALHAGALAYREDLSRAETAATAQTILTGAQSALTELRQVLGVLRDGGAVRTQPTLAELPALLADVREAGAVVRLDTSQLPDGAVPDPAGLPDILSRTSFRILQESLTNARKHAPGEPVDVWLSGTAGTQLGIEVRNRVAVMADAMVNDTGVADAVPVDAVQADPAPARPAPPSHGVGLAGLGERAALAGGTLAYGAGPDGVFVVSARLPWPT